MSENSDPQSDGAPENVTPENAPENAASQDAAPPEAAQPATTPDASAGSPEGSDEAKSRFKVQVGRQPDAAGPKPKAKPAPLAPSIADPEAKQVDPLERPPLPEKPSRRDPLSADLQAEIDAALGDLSLDALVDGGADEELEVDSKRQAKVLRVDEENVFFSIDGRREGIVPLRQMKETPELGAVMEVVVTGFNADDGLYDLSIPGASIEVGDWSDISEGALVEARITGSNTGGLECQVNNLRGFIPVSQIALFRVENMAEFLDQKMVCVVTEANPERRNLVLSRRAVLERERQEEREKKMGELAPGQVHEGVVRNILDFGAFVDIGGVEGLVHVSKLSWDRVNHPKDVVEVGQQVKVKIDKIDPQSGKIGLSLRDTTTHPWATAQQQFAPGTVVSGVVSKIATFGAFVRLAPGIEGLVHISEIAHQRVQAVSAYLREGQEVEVKILEIDMDNQRMSLSIKQTQQAPAGKKDKKKEEDETPVERTFKKPSGPLKGGTDRPSGGESFGLKW